MYIIVNVYVYVVVCVSLVVWKMTLNFKYLRFLPHIISELTLKFFVVTFEQTNEFLNFQTISGCVCVCLCVCVCVHVCMPANVHACSLLM